MKDPAMIASLRDPQNLPHPAADVELKETHISWVLLAGEFAYKIKKPVNFGFLDFSTLDARKRYCELEVELNRRMAPELYLGVLPVRRQGARFFIGEGTGEIVDWAVWMRRFPDEDLLDARLARGDFDPAWMEALALRVARFHAQAQIAPEGFGSAAQLREHVLDNIAVARRWVGRGLDAALVDALAAWAERTCADKAELIEARRREGYVRACHGDLHLRNIVLWRGEPIPFDCIEFNDDFRFIDVMNDVAFLVMDLDARKHPAFGLRFLSVWLEQTGDYAGLALLDLFRFYRAGVRGKVALLTAEGAADERTRAQFIEEARRYFQLAQSYTMPRTPKLYAVGGFSGSGKSHLARIGMEKAHALVIRSDATRKRIASAFPDEPLYGDAMHARTYAAMFEAAEKALRAGFSVILDATFLHPKSREDLRALAERLRVPAELIWLDVPVETLRARIAKRTETGQDISDADLRVLEMQLAKHAPPSPDEPGVRFWTDSGRWPEDV